jgi:hypothetical protein
MNTERAELHGAGFQGTRDAGQRGSKKQWALRKCQTYVTSYNNNQTVSQQGLKFSPACPASRVTSAIAHGETHEAATSAGCSILGSGQDRAPRNVGPGSTETLASHDSWQRDRALARAAAIHRPELLRSAEPERIPSGEPELPVAVARMTTAVAARRAAPRTTTTKLAAGVAVVSRTWSRA